MARRNTQKTKMIHKKGSAQDLILVMGIIFGAAMIFLIGFVIMNEINDGIQGSSVTESRSKTASTKLLGYYPGVIDNAFLFLTVGLCMLTLVMAALVRVSPVFVFFFFIIYVFTIVVSGALSNAYVEASTSPAIIAQGSQLGGIGFVLTYLPLIIGVFGGLLAVVMYVNWRSMQ